MREGERSEFAIVTGASSGIGLEFVKLLARDGARLLLVADEPLGEAARLARSGGAAEVTTLEADLATDAGLLELLARLAKEPVDVLIANAGDGQGGRLLDQDWKRIRHIIDTNVTGTARLVHAVAQQMRQAGHGRILVTGSIVADMPGPFNLAYNASKAFVVKFCAGLSEELESSPVTVTCLLPGAVDTPFFAKADMTDTLVGRLPKYRPEKVARDGYTAMREGRRKVVSGLMARLQYGIADVLPDAAVAKLHRLMARPL